jgi:hypothetical protein
MTQPPAAVTYARVVSRESVRIGFLIAALNDLNILSADIENAYLTSTCEERIYTVLGPDFGPNRQGKKSLVVRALTDFILQVPAVETILRVALVILGINPREVTQVCGFIQRLR